MSAIAPAPEIQPVFDPSLSPGEILEIRASSLNRLSTLLRLVEGAWAVAVYESGTMRQQMEERLIGKIAPVTLQTVPLTGRTPDPLAVMQDGGDAPVLSLYGFGNRMADFCGYLDVQRESLARHPHRLLLWVSAYEQRILAQNAPNFYSRLSGVFYFPGGVALSAATSHPVNGAATQTPARPETSGPALSEAPTGSRRRPYLPVADSRDRQRQAEYLNQRIHSLRQQRRPDSEAIGDAWYDLAGLYGTDLPNRWAEAEAAYSEAARAYAQAGRSLAEAEARYQAGDAAMRAYAHPAALAHFDNALALYRLFTDTPDDRMARLGEANVLQAQGDVLYFLKKTDEALEKYERALGLFQAVGDRLGEANVLIAQGDVALQNGEVERGFGLLEEARQLYALIGAQSGLANIGIRLGRYAAAQGDFAHAIECMQPAADFCFEIGHPLGEQLQAEIDGWRAQTPP